MSSRLAWPVVAALGLLAAPAAAEVTGLVYTRDGKSLMAVDVPGRVCVYDAGTGKLRREVRAGETLYALALSPDGKTLALGGTRRVVRLWDAGTLKEVGRLEGAEEAVLSLAFAPDGRSLAAGCRDQRVCLWDLPGGKLRARLPHTGGPVTGVAFSPDGKTLAVAGLVGDGFAGTSGLVSFWEADSGKRRLDTSQKGRRVLFTPDGIAAVTAGLHAELDAAVQVRVWHARSDRLRREFSGKGTAVALSPDGRYLAIGWGSFLHAQSIRTGKGPTGAIHLVELATGKEVLRVPAEGRDVTVLAFAPDGRRVAAGRGDGGVDLHDLAPEKWQARPRLSDADRRKCWETLAGADAAAAYRAVWDLTADGEDAVRLIADHLSPAKAGRPDVAALLRDLDSRSFPRREEAARRLVGLGPPVEPALLRALEAGPSLESRRRLERVLGDIANSDLPPARVREERALTVVERVGGKESVALLRAIAAGAGESHLTTQARLALERLGALPGRGGPQ